MRPTSFLFLVSSVFLVANAIPIPVDTSELTTIHERDVAEVDLADVDRRDLDETQTGDLEKRVKTAPKAKAVPKKVTPPKTVPKKTAPPKTVPKKTAPPKTVPKKSAPPKSAPPKTAPPKSVPTKAPPKSAPPKSAPPKTAPPKSVPTKAPPKSVSKSTAKPTGPKTTAKPPATKASSKPAASATGKACALKPKPGTKPGTKPAKGARGYDDLEKRAAGTFTKANAPATITIKLKGKDFALTKFAKQGENGATYTVTVDGKPAFAKTDFTAGSIKQEAELSAKVNLLIDSGSDENCDNAIQAEWIITKKVDGTRLEDTQAFAKAAGKKAECDALVDKAVELTVAAVNKFFADTGFDHGDGHPGNVFFDDNVTTATLIDFGKAAQRKPNSQLLLLTKNRFAAQKNLCLNKAPLAA